MSDPVINWIVTVIAYLIRRTVVVHSPDFDIVLLDVLQIARVGIHDKHADEDRLNSLSACVETTEAKVIVSLDFIRSKLRRSGE